MAWQDIVIAAANLVFVYSLLHQVIFNFKHKKCLITLTTSGLTTVGMLALGITFYSLSLIFSTVVVSVTAILWGTVFFQRLGYKTIE